MTDLSSGILERVAAAANFQEAAERLTDWALELTGCEAAMLRFGEDDPQTGRWIPALVERGFGCNFVRDELLIGEDECLCGRICRGCVDTSLPFFTPGGSFSWGGVQTIAEEYPIHSLGKIRGRCIVEGFESVVIVPLTAGGAAIGCLHLADFAPDKFAHHLETIEAVCRQCGPSLLRFSYEDRQASVIRAVETVLAPPGLQQVPGLEIAVSYSSATEAAHLGGDFFDVIELDGGDVLLIAGDYSGKGLSAAGMAARARQAIAAAAAAERAAGDGSGSTAGGAGSTVRLLVAADARLRGTLPKGGFVSVVACRYSPGGALEVTSAGHPFPLVLEPDGAVEELALQGNPPLGFLGERPLRSGTARLRPGQTLLLYTDGITESRSGGRFFGIEGIAEYWRGSVGADLATDAGPATDLAALTAGLCRASADYHQADLAGDDRLALAVRPTRKARGPGAGSPGADRPAGRPGAAKTG